MLYLYFFTILILFIFNASYFVFADVNHQSPVQRLGNYEVHFTTIPSNPIVGNSTRFEIMVHSTDGDLLTDIPVEFKLMKDLKVIDERDILIPFGVYRYDYYFNQSGEYILDITIKDDVYSNSQLDFYYYINTLSSSESYGNLYYYLLGAIIIIGLGISFYLLNKKKLWPVQHK